MAGQVCGRYIRGDSAGVRMPMGCIAYWPNLANTIEPSVCGSDAALCQIALTTCCDYYYCTVSYKNVHAIFPS